MQLFYEIFKIECMSVESFLNLKKKSENLLCGIANVKVGTKKISHCFQDTQSL